MSAAILVFSKNPPARLARPPRLLGWRAGLSEQARDGI